MGCHDTISRDGHHVIGGWVPLSGDRAGELADADGGRAAAAGQDDGDDGTKRTLLGGGVGVSGNNLHVCYLSSLIQ